MLYLLYLAFETLPVVGGALARRRGERAPLLVLLFYPLYGAVNTVLRTLALSGLAVDALRHRQHAAAARPARPGAA